MAPLNAHRAVLLTVKFEFKVGETLLFLRKFVWAFKRVEFVGDRGIMCQKTSLVWSLHSSGMLRSVGICLSTFRDSLSVQSSRVKRSKNMGRVDCPETSVNFYQPKLRNKVEERTPSVHRCDSLGCVLKASNYCICISQAQQYFWVWLNKFIVVFQFCGFGGLVVSMLASGT